MHNYYRISRTVAALLVISISCVLSAQHQVIKMTTVLSEGEISFGLAAAEEGTAISIDWGDGNTQLYRIGPDYNDVKGVIKGTELSITGDITKLNATANKLTAIALNKCSRITVLQLSFNFLSNIDISECPNLQNLEIFQNTIKEIDLTKNNKLIRLVCSGNFLETIDLSQCPELEYFDCARMSRIKGIDLSNCHKLKNLIVNACSFKELALSEKAPLEELLCDQNKLTTLDLSAHPTLKIVACSKNPLSKLTLKPEQLESLAAMETKLSALDLSDATKLKSLMLKDNKELSLLNLSNVKALESLGVSECKLATLELGEQPLLKQLWCNGNLLTQLDASQCTTLERLEAKENKLQKLLLPQSLLYLLIAQNQLKTIDFTSCKALQVLNLNGNPLKGLDITALSHLNMLGIVGCGFNACQLNKVYAQLPPLPKPSAKINLYNGTKTDKEAATSHSEAAVKKNWKPAINGDNTGCKDGASPLLADYFFEVAIKGGNTIAIHTDSPEGEIRLFASDGTLVLSKTILAGETTLLPQKIGTYIIEYIAIGSRRHEVKKLILGR